MLLGFHYHLKIWVHVKQCPVNIPHGYSPHILRFLKEALGTLWFGECELESLELLVRWFSYLLFFLGRVVEFHIKISRGA